MLLMVYTKEMDPFQQGFACCIMRLYHNDAINQYSESH